MSKFGQINLSPAAEDNEEEGETAKIKINVKHNKILPALERTK